MRTCDWCGEQFRPIQSTQRFCKTTHRKSAWQKQMLDLAREAQSARIRELAHA